MLTVSKGPSKIVAKTRRGVPQNYEKLFEIKESGRRSSDLNSPENKSAPRPVFKKSASNGRHIEEVSLTPQHEEIVQYINDSWNVIVAHNPYDSAFESNGHPEQPTDSNNNSAGSSIASTSTSSAASSVCTSPQPTASIYCIEPPSPVLSDFKPFDLVTWWYDRLCDVKST
uniref:Protein FAM195A n=1 Tax=Bactrocera dorsalis TaxID=27457 RepID=A0A034W484_BACDO